MQKVHGKPYRRYFSRKDKGVITVVILIALALLITAYYCVAEPIISRFLITTTQIHEGMEYFGSREYIQFESGSRFYELLQKIDCGKLGEVVDFYHVDNQLRDNPIYGKMCDVFSIDIQANPQMYAGHKKELLQTGHYCCDMEDYELFVLDYDTGKKGDVVLMAVCDRQCIFRIILLTDKDPVSDNSRYGTTLIQQSSLVWTVAQ